MTDTHEKARNNPYMQMRVDTFIQCQPASAYNTSQDILRWFTIIPNQSFAFWWRQLLFLSRCFDALKTQWGSIVTEKRWNRWQEENLSAYKQSNERFGIIVFQREILCAVRTKYFTLSAWNDRRTVPTFAKELRMTQQRENDWMKTSAYTSFHIF